MADSRYRIIERVAAGGMAEVFRGVAESLQGFKKSVAVKRILPALTKNKKFIAMFLDEARLSLLLQHANIVQVFDIGHTDDTYFIVMEYVDGIDLKSLLEWRRRAGRRIPIAQTVFIAMEICRGLSYAHDLLNPETGRPLGIVHRDISPPNVLISKQGEIKVVDFGLAKASSQIETTDPGVVKGKMSYLSPEAARGEEVDSRADIFAVGILLYEMLTGRRLFYGETDYQTVELVRNARIPPIRAQNPEVEQELESVVLKALAKDRDNRFQSAGDLQDALANYAYSRGLKVIPRDIADLVRQCLEDKATQSSGGRRRGGNLVDTLLQDEINKFTSVDFEEPSEQMSPDDLSYPHADAGGDFIDPRAWSMEAPQQQPSRRGTGSMTLGTTGTHAVVTNAGDHSAPAGGRRTATDDRATVKDNGEIAAQAARARRTEQAPTQATSWAAADAPVAGDVGAGPTAAAGTAAIAGTMEPTARSAPKKSFPMPPVRWIVVAAAVVITLGIAAAAVVAKRSGSATGAVQQPSATSGAH